MPWFEHTASHVYYEETGSGDPLLLLPGFAGSIAEMGPLRDALAAHYRVIAADLPGSGRSEPQPRVYPVSYYDDDAHTFLALVEHLQLGTPHVLGFSDGGEVAILMAVLQPQQIRSVVAWGAAGALSEAQRPMLDVLAMLIDNPIPPMRSFSDHLKAAYGVDNARATMRNFVQAARGILERGGDISLTRAGAITCPVLLIVGENDMLAT
ncbi:MAG TPA: alpha/beta fold hydrolase, partial [Roseiflexaceae bacterium]|nr:alpha/beta fold hydrolase [Roseiflexaceae bacterium]